MVDIRNSGEHMITGYRTLNSVFNAIAVPFNKVLDYETKVLDNVDIYLTMRDRYNLKIDLRWNRDKCNKVVMDFINKKFNGMDCYCVWLCDNICDVKNYYAHNEEIIEVILPNNALIVSDLGAEGKLYVIHVGQTYSWNTVLK